MDQAFFTFPGIAGILSASMTELHGISPSVITVNCKPQPTLPQLNGTARFIFGKVTISFINCKIDRGSIQRDGNGMVVSFRLFDRRWKWKDGWVHGRYNIHYPNKDLDKTTEQSPRELCELLLDAMGEKNFDISALPNSTNPEVSWTYANPAQELAKLVDMFGCRIVLDRKNRVVLCRLGIGKTLPETRRLDGGFSIDSPEKPESAIVVGGETRFQSLLMMEAIAEDPDGREIPLDDLPYKPVNGWEYEVPTSFSNVTGSSPEERESNRQLALKTVYRKYRVKAQWDGSLRVPGLNELKLDGYTLNTTGPHIDKIERLLPLDSVLLDRKPDKKFKRPDEPAEYKLPYIVGRYFPENAILRNTHIGSLFDGEFNLDAEHGKVEFIKPVYKLETIEEKITVLIPPYNTPEERIIKRIVHKPADLFLMVAYGVEEPEARLRFRYVKEKGVDGHPVPATYAQTLNHDEIVEKKVAIYKYQREEQPGPSGLLEFVVTAFTLDKVKTNTDEIDKQADYYLNATIDQYRNTETIDYGYDGIVDIELDGLIAQVGFEIGQDGAKTRASANNEFDFDIPTYENRRLFETLRLGKFDKK